MKRQGYYDNSTIFMVSLYTYRFSTQLNVGGIIHQTSQKHLT